MISSLSSESWDAKVIELGGSILQSWTWGQFQQSLGHKLVRFSSDNFASSTIITALQAGKSYAYSPRGPVGDEQEFLTDLKELGANDHDIIFARLEPQHAMDLPVSIKETQPLNNWVLALDKTEEELLIGMKPKTRYNINLAQRKGVTVRVGDQSDLLAVYKLFLETSERNKYKLHPQNYYWHMWDHLSPNHVKILIAEYQGKVLSAMILGLFGDTAAYLHGGSSNIMKEAMAPFLMHFEAIKLSKQLGYKFYDFGGVSSSNDPNHSWAGISRFKKGFGGFEVNYPGSYDLIFSPIWYNVYKQARLVRKLMIR